MSMHIDVFFLKKGLDISKQVYLTVIYRCDQGMANTLSICENVLKEFKKANPTITTFLLSLIMLDHIMETAFLKVSLKFVNMLAFS